MAKARTRARADLGACRSRVSDVPETRTAFRPVADEPTRAAVARLAGLSRLPRLEASFDVTPHGQRRPACGRPTCRRLSARPAWSRSSRSRTRSTSRRPRLRARRTRRRSSAHAGDEIDGGRVTSPGTRWSAAQSISARSRPNSCSSASILIRANRTRCSSRRRRSDESAHPFARARGAEESAQGGKARK